MGDPVLLEYFSGDVTSSATRKPTVRVSLTGWDNWDEVKVASNV